MAKTGMSGQHALPDEDMYAKRLANAGNTRAWRLEQRGIQAVAFLKRNGFDALFVADCALARKEVLSRVPEGATVGAGGALTIRHLGVLDALAEAGHTLYDHWRPGLSQEEILAARSAQLTCDVFLSSVNALTLKGQLVSTDGIGNRVAAMTFGPGKVILAVGAQKIVPDLDTAFARLRDVCAPLALRETGADIPCVQTGVCGNCHKEERLCRATVVLECRPLLTDMTVIVIGEEVGF